MANAEIVKFEAEVDKLCADWVVGVNKDLQKVTDAVSTLTDALRGRISSLRLPQKAGPDELNELPARINEILRENSVRLKGIVEVELHLTIDAKAKKLANTGYRMSGHLNSL